MANVTPYYPASVVSYGADVVDFSSTVLAAHINTLRAEVSSVESVLGTYVTLSSGWVGSFTQPSISYTWGTLKDRINNIEYGLNAVYNAMVPTGGTSGQVLVKNSGTDYDFSWTTANFLPSQGSNNGKFLTTNGTAASWAAISQVPSQTGNNGYFLTTNGTAASWSAISQVPSQSGNNGKYLTTNGTSASWATIPVTSQATTTSLGTVYGVDNGSGGSGGMLSLGYNSLAYGSGTLAATTVVGIGAAQLARQGTASNNTAIGYVALANAIPGSDNTAIGQQSGYVVTGGQNTLVGSNAGSSITSGSNNLVLGYNAQASAATISNEITIGNSSITKLRIPGLNVDTSAATNGQMLTWNTSTGKFQWTTPTSTGETFNPLLLMGA